MQQKWANPLMGWTSGKDTLGSQIFHHLTFDSPYVLPALASIPAHNCDRAAQCSTRLFAFQCAAGAPVCDLLHACDPWATTAYRFRADSRRRICLWQSWCWVLNIFVLHREKAVEYCQKLNFEYRVEAVRESKVNKKIAKRYEDNFRSHPLARISQLPVPCCRSSSPLSGRPPAAPFPCADFLFLLLRTHGVREGLSTRCLSLTPACRTGGTVTRKPRIRPSGTGRQNDPAASECCTPARVPVPWSYRYLEAYCQGVWLPRGKGQLVKQTASVLISGLS